MMIFPDGVKRIGFFEQNIYKQSMETIEQFDLEVNETKVTFP
jgi:hypothetical protein